MKSAVALVDCNTFYASCERAFDRKLEGKPVVVLSNNDGCVISCSTEARQLGLKIGFPLFKMKELIAAHDIRVFSSNYDLYGDMSQRVMSTLAHFTPSVEVYSIDEAFLDLSGMDRKGLTEQGRAIRNAVRQWTGIPVSIGIAATKTLAKVANHIAKRSHKTNGVLDLTDSPHLEKALEITPIGSVWGVGWRRREFFHKEGITNARELRDREDGWVKKNLGGVVGLRTVWELRGTPCIELDSAPASRKSVIFTRSFGQHVETIEEMREAVATYVSRAAEKLRRQKLSASFISVAVRTTRQSESYHGEWTPIHLSYPTDSTAELIAHALDGLEKIFRPGYRYNKAGVMLADLVPTEQVQLSAFDTRDRDRLGAVARLLDEVNLKSGSRVLSHAAVGTEQEWKMKSKYRSPCYTTRWEDIPGVKC